MRTVLLEKTRKKRLAEARHPLQITFLTQMFHMLLVAQTPNSPACPAPLGFGADRYAIPPMRNAANCSADFQVCRIASRCCETNLRLKNRT